MEKQREKLQQRLKSFGIDKLAPYEINEHGMAYMERGVAFITKKKKAYIYAVVFNIDNDEFEPMPSIIVGPDPKKLFKENEELLLNEKISRGEKTTDSPLA